MLFRSAMKTRSVVAASAIGLVLAAGPAMAGGGAGAKQAAGEQAVDQPAGQVEGYQVQEADKPLEAGSPARATAEESERFDVPGEAASQAAESPVKIEGEVEGDREAGAAATYGTVTADEEQAGAADATPVTEGAETEQD